MKRFRIKGRIDPLALENGVVSYIVEERRWLFFWAPIKSDWESPLEFHTIKEAKDFIVENKRGASMMAKGGYLEYID